MSDNTGIEWTTATWNPVTGCSKVSQGCKNCYALRDWARLSANPKAKKYYGREFTDVMCHPETLDQPLSWQKPRRIFVNSMSDLFHEDVPESFIFQVFAIMAAACHHTFQVLTKRPERMLDIVSEIYNGGMYEAAQSLDQPFIEAAMYAFSHGLPNVWLGVSVEDQATADERIPLLLETPAAVRWLSMEPLLGYVDLSIINGVTHDGGIPVEWQRLKKSGIDWVVVGGESGPHKIGYKTVARPMHPLWVRSLRDQCISAGIPFFFKQWGNFIPHDKPAVHGTNNGAGCYVRTDGSFGNQSEYWDGTAAGMNHVGKKAAGRMLDGRTWDEFPENDQELK